MTDHFERTSLHVAKTLPGKNPNTLLHGPPSNLLQDWINIQGHMNMLRTTYSPVLVTITEATLPELESGKNCSARQIVGKHRSPDDKQEEIGNNRQQKTQTQLEKQLNCCVSATNPSRHLWEYWKSYNRGKMVMLDASTLWSTALNWQMTIIKSMLKLTKGTVYFEGVLKCGNRSSKPLTDLSNTAVFYTNSKVNQHLKILNDVLQLKIKNIFHFWPFCSFGWNTMMVEQSFQNSTRCAKL